MSSKGYTKLQGEKNQEGKPFISSLEIEEENSGEYNKKSKKALSTKQKILITVFAVLTLAVVAVISVLLHKNSAWFYGTKRVLRADRKFTLEEVLGGKYSFSSYSVTWVSDNSYLRNENGLYLYNMDKVDKIIPVLTSEEYYESHVSMTSMSPDNNWLMFSNNSHQLYRHSSYADFYIKYVNSNSSQSIFKITKPDDDQNEQIRYCGWANNGSAFVFVYKCNIYYVPSAADVPMRYFKLTDDGVPKKIFNGVPDWVYEEEIIASTNAIEFSNDGSYMSYVKFNATDVPYYKFPKYGPVDRQYTKIEKIAYPKAGYPNPTIKVTIVDIKEVLKYQNNEKFKARRSHPKPPSELAKGEYYYAVMKWTSGNELFVQWMNRAQNVTMCMTYVTTKNTGKVLEQHTTPNGWIDDDYVKPKFSTDGSYYVTMLPKDDNRHLAKVSLKGNKSIEYLTAGNKFWVQDINCYDKDNEVVYFRSTEGSPRYRHVFSIDVKTKEKKCITCGVIKDTAGNNCTYHYPSFSKQCTWATIFCQGPFVPRTYMMNVKEGRTFSLTNNDKVIEQLKERDVPINIYYTVKSDGYEIPVKETRPANFDPKRKYAVLFDVYGGPNTQKVTDKFTIFFSEYLATKNEFILINCDARGAGFYGYKFLHAVYKKLGYYESIDAINVAKYLAAQPYIDASRMAIWGWSYGGFYAAITLAMSEGLIKTAVSVAPVTDWRYYDTVYSERYMGLPTPADNLKGYEDTNVMSKAKNFRGKNFMLIHGTADDNVHFQNSAQLVNALIQEQIKFRSQFYPDRDHSIQSNGHIYYLISDYLSAHLTKNHKHYSTNSTFGFNLDKYLTGK